MKRTIRHWAAILGYASVSGILAMTLGVMAVFMNGVFEKSVIMGGALILMGITSAIIMSTRFRAWIKMQNWSSGDQRDVVGKYDSLELCYDRVVADCLLQCADGERHIHAVKVQDEAPVYGASNSFEYALFPVEYSSSEDEIRKGFLLAVYLDYAWLATPAVVTEEDALDDSAILAFASQAPLSTGLE